MRAFAAIGGWICAAWLCGALAIPQSVAADPKRWTKLQTCGVGPSERSRPAVAALGRDIYLFGGGFDEFASGEFQFYDDLFVLDTRSARWQQLSPEGERPAPRAFAGHAALDRGRGFVVFGGGTFASDQSVTSYGDLWQYSLADGRWLRLSDEPAGPGKRFDPKVWAHAGKVYVFGGLTETYEVTNDLWAFDLSTGAWSIVTENGAAGSPPARGVARGPDRAADGLLYFYSGEGGPDTSFQIFDDTWAFDVRAGQWRELTPTGACQLDAARNHNSVARIGRDLYAYGGDVSGGPQSCGAPFPQNPVAELWRFDTRTTCWEIVDETRGEAPPPLKRHEAVTVGNAMYLLAGYDFAANGGAEACQVWNLDVWVFR
jgi:hypothetical protein